MTLASSPGCDLNTDSVCYMRSGRFIAQGIASAPVRMSRCISALHFWIAQEVAPSVGGAAMA